MKLLWLTCILVYYFKVEGVQSETLHNVCQDVKGYYWRDFAGDIPSDALAGGMEDQNNPIYIGQTIYPEYGVIVPGKISSTTKKMYYESDQTEHTVTEEVKILCTAHAEHFQWIRTQDNETVSSVVKGNKQLIVGGHYRPNPIAIGRRNVGEEVQVGKVLVVDGVFKSIHLTKNGKGWEESSFDVLVYSPPESNVQKHCSVQKDDCDVHKTLTINLYT